MSTAPVVAGDRGPGGGEMHPSIGAPKDATVTWSLSDIYLLFSFFNWDHILCRCDPIEGALPIPILGEF